MDFYGLIGQNIEGNLSEKLYNKIFGMMKQQASFKNFDISKEDLGLAISSLRLLDIRGATVTMPYKELAYYLCDELDDVASRTSCVNLLTNNSGKIKGYNTGYFAFEKLYDKVCPSGVSTAVLLGNGGSVKTISHFLRDRGLRKITIVSRRIEDSELENTRIVPYDLLPDIMADLIVNTTPVGMYPQTEECILDDNLFKNYRYAIDLICNPIETEFIRRAKKKKLACAGGLEMFLWQTLKAMEIWFGKEFSETEIKQIKKIAKELI